MTSKIRIEMKLKLSVFLTCMLCACMVIVDMQAQQDPQYTQYMYNTMSVNPAYVGSRGHTTITGLGRTQWVGLEGAPDTQTLSYDTPLGYSGLGLGFNLVNDKIGPSHELYLDGNLSYTIETGEEGNLAFGLKLGGRLLNIDWNLGRTPGQDPVFQENIVNKFLPTIGAGVYYHEPQWYIGLSIPNFLRKEHYDEESPRGEVAVERSHFFLITGYVFDLNENIKFKPAALVKGVSGSPLSLDVSANFLFQERFTAGIAWRWDDAISALLGFQASESLYIGYAYDLTTSNYNVVNTGTHEVMLRYEIFKQPRFKSPRFF
ncbi:PorP/SprF family type IX secretion system membrane protein [Tenacibaculum maritimum]|uniref:PorP/SprF family type IX secretion system membrane protein n=2 Tax=Tenacibaculum maritimum TaxID=107401 RepID=UPI0012E5A350|nr:type IX secretion system membrane protein PorP/SprF [Tenacibaculum maritimum]MCD9636093.1 type IX secretion system membrane protein PorP/SprF [Tenacibaculum maritimum]CAA0174115.1 Type IX secretion system membrane protein, PorP/SprF family [Tenacibaculum maritimum]CAA0177369.1 Type IX secretion system membrane protein, PorP/SprF family [Tenacibaculum maritimum]